MAARNRFVEPIPGREGARGRFEEPPPDREAARNRTEKAAPENEAASRAAGITPANHEKRARLGEQTSPDASQGAGSPLEELILPRLEGLFISDEQPGRALAILATNQRSLELPLDCETVLAVEDNEGKAVGATISPPPTAVLEMRTVAIEEEGRRSYVIAYSLPLTCKFHTHVKVDSNELRISLLADVRNEEAYDITGGRLSVAMGGIDCSVNDFTIPARTTVQMVLEDSFTECAFVWVIDVAAETAVKMVQFDLPHHYCFPDGLDLATVKTAGGAVRTSKKALVSGETVLVPWQGLPDFEYAVSYDAKLETYLVQVKIAEEDGKKKGKESRTSSP